MLVNDYVAWGCCGQMFFRRRKEFFPIGSSCPTAAMALETWQEYVLFKVGARCAAPGKTVTPIREKLSGIDWQNPSNFSLLFS